MRLIRTQDEYAAALARVEELMTAVEGSPEADELDVAVILIEKYEQERFSIPDAPVSEVLKLVMEQRDLTQKDLVPYLGSPSTVSKVLGGKKELTLAQVRALHKGLAIPVEALVGGEDPAPRLDWTAFPLVEMAKRGLFGPDFEHATASALAKTAQELVSGLLGTAKLDFSCQPCLRQGLKPSPASDPYAVMAWLVEVARSAHRQAVNADYQGLTRTHLRELAKLSKSKAGIREAVAHLSRLGVPVAIVPYYRRSKVDGGVVILDGDRPAIGISLRYDRIDHFWFTLLHEVAHIVCGHVRDYLAEIVADEASSEAVELEANTLVEEVTVPQHAFDRAIPDPKKATLGSVIDLAQRFDVSIAIVVGRVQYKSGDFRKFSKLLGHGTVRDLFAVSQAKRSHPFP